MILFREHEMPPTCYVQEAAYWLTFGRLPEWFPYEDKGDARQIPEAFLDSGEPEGYDNGYTRAEFMALGIQVDYERYVDAKNSFSEEWIRETLRLHRTGAAEHVLISDEYASLLEADLAEHEWANEMDTLLFPAVDRARASVFQALSLGEIGAKGWVDLVSYEPDSRDIILDRKIEELGEFRDIPNTAWSLRGFDWQNSILQTRGQKFTLVQISTEDMLRVFPEPLSPQTTVRMRAYAGCGILLDEEDSVPSKPLRRRGRPPKLGGVVREAIQNYFRDRVLKSGASDKREAIVQDAIDFAKLVFNETISRPTAQNYLAALAPKRQVPENMPEIHAGK